jgi:signal transduction histidine kinase
MSLVKGAEEIGKGKLDYRIKVRSKDEIGILAGAFNSMVKSLEESQRQLIQSEKLASLGQLAAGIAHEINNPLTNISNNAQMLQQEVGGRAAKRLKVIEENIDKASRIVRNLLDFSRAPEFHPEFIDITLLLEKSLEFMEHDLKRIEVVKRFSKNLPEVLVDPLQIQQVFVNLITNACQAMPNGGRLTLTTDSTDKTVEVRISDTGEGIPKEHMDKIFDPFFTTRKVGKGTGLGLSISYRIIDRHGGRIKVESEVGKGSTFIIELPVED